MHVLLVVGHIDFKRGELHAALRRHTGSGTLLLRGYQLQFQAAKLQVRAQSEQRTGALY